MRVRRIAELKRTQAQMLTSIRAAQDPVVDTPIAEAPASGMLGLARVVSIVPDDPEQGAHLVVARQKCAGLPPAFADGPVSNQVAYPAPGHVVANHAVDSFVLCYRVHGVIVALKLA